MCLPGTDTSQTGLGTGMYIALAFAFGGSERGLPFAYDFAFGGGRDTLVRVRSVCFRYPHYAFSRFILELTKVFG